MLPNLHIVIDVVRVSDKMRYRPVPAVRRAIAILRLLGQAPHPLSVSAVAKQLDIVPSTALHTLRELTREGLVAFDQETKRYQIDAGVLTLASGLLKKGRFAYRIQPGLNRVAEEFGVAAFALRVGTAYTTVVAAGDQDQPVRVEISLGTKRPLMLGATGRLVAAFSGRKRADLVKLLREADWFKPPSVNKWWGEVRAAKRRGFAVDRGNSNPGLTAIGVPFFNDDHKLDHTVVAVGATEHCEAIGISRIADALKEALTHA